MYESVNNATEFLLSKIKVFDIINVVDFLKILVISRSTVILIKSNV